jgi:hypothetical protein
MADTSSDKAGMKLVPRAGDPLKIAYVMLNFILILSTSWSQ